MLDVYARDLGTAGHHHKAHPSVFKHNGMRQI